MGPRSASDPNPPASAGRDAFIQSRGKNSDHQDPSSDYRVVCQPDVSVGTVEASRWRRSCRLVRMRPMSPVPDGTGDADVPSWLTGCSRRPGPVGHGQAATAARLA
jgi:hypothetical protein